jgi:hypothetical protein
MRRWFGTVLVIAGVTAACGAFSSTSGNAIGLDAGQDVEGARAERPADGGGSSVPDASSSGDNLFASGDFEGADDCVAWGSYRAIVDRASLAHSGDGSCVVCQYPEAGSSAVDVYVRPGSFAIVNPEAGARYGGSLWVRPNVDQIEVDVGFEGDDGDGGTYTLTGPNNTLAPARWTAVGVQGSVPANARSLRLRVHSVLSPGDCFFIDQASVVQLN